MKVSKDTKSFLTQIKDDELMSNVLLCKYPLYDYCTNNEIHILCLGSGQFVKSMILTAIGAGQMIGRELFIHVVSQNAYDFRDDLFGEFPELKNYAKCVTKKTKETTLTEAEVANYVTFSFQQVKDLLNENTYSKIAKDYAESRYVIISIGEDGNKNKELAQNYAVKLAECSEKESIIHYYSGKKLRKTNSTSTETTAESADKTVACQSKKTAKTKRVPALDTKNVKVLPFKSGLSLYQNDIEKLAIRAFRVHYLYSKQYDPFVSKTKCEDEFKDSEYSQYSSLGTAVHIEYKLQSLGIPVVDTNLQDTDVEEYQARVIAQYTDCLQDTKKYHQLLALEHRRWMMAQIAYKYKKPTIEELQTYSFNYVGEKFNAAFSCREKDLKRHHCLVPCTDEVKRLPVDPREWDKYGSIEEIQKLDEFDELDKMSLLVHFIAKERIMRNNGLKISGILAGLNEILQNNRLLADDVKKEGLEFIDFVNRVVLHKNTAHLRERMADIRILFEKNGISAEHIFKELKDELAIFVEFNSYKDYKNSDATIIDNLLWFAFAQDFYMVREKSKAIASNLIIPLVMEPKTLCFFGDILKQKEDPIDSFFRKHGNNTEISYTSVYLNDMDVITKNFLSMYKKGNNSEKMLIDVTDSSPAFTVAAVLFAQSHKNVGVIAWDTENEKVINLANYPAASTYRLNTYISAQEVFELYGSQLKFKKHDDVYGDPLSVDSQAYMWHMEPYVDALWNFYKENSSDWGAICQWMRSAQSEKYLFLENVKFSVPEQWGDYSVCVPANTYDTLGISRIMQDLQNYKAIRNLSAISRYEDVLLKFQYRLATDGSHILKSKLHDFFQKNAIGTKKLRYYIGPPEKKGAADGISKFMIYSDVANRKGSLNAIGNLTNENLTPRKILESFKDMKLLKNLVINQGANSFSFEYTSNAISIFFGKEGNLLELNAFYCAKAAGCFDTVRANVNFLWENQAVSNELDLVLTKGVKTWICSCKMGKVDKDYKQNLYEVESLARHFSINSVPVLIASSPSVEKDDAIINRAKEMGIQLITYGQVTTDFVKAFRNLVGEEDEKASEAPSLDYPDVKAEDVKVSEAPASDSSDVN